MYADYIGFLTTHWHLTHGEKKDPLENIEWVNWYVHRITGRQIDSTTTAIDFERLTSALIQIRGELMAVAASIQDNSYSEEKAIELLTAYLKGSKGHRSIVVDESNMPKLTFEPEQFDVDYILADIAQGWFNLLFEMDYTRIKICEDPDCLCYFYDESKNKTKRHCAPNCSNRMKVRRHREKKKTEL